MAKYDKNTDAGVGGFRRGGYGRLVAFVFTLCALFPTGAILVYLFHQKLFRKMRNRPLWVFLPSLAVSALVYIAAKHGGWFHPSFLDVAWPGGFTFAEIGNVKSVDPMSVLVYVVKVLWIVGAIGSFLVVGAALLSDMSALKKNPEQKSIKENWAYQWEYRRTPLENRRYKKKLNRIRRGRAGTDDYAVIGLRAEYEEERPNGRMAIVRDDEIRRYNKEAVGHTIVLGASGSGKTITTLAMVKNDIMSGIPVAYVDFKRSDDVPARMAKWAHEAGMGFKHFLDCDPKDYRILHSDGPCTYNPFQNADKGIPDMIINMRKYDTAAEVYRAATKEVTVSIESMLRVVRKYPQFLVQKNGESVIHWEMGEIYVWLDALENVEKLYAAYAAILKKAGKPVDKRMAAVVGKMLDGKTMQNKGLESARGSFTTFANSAYAPYLDMSGDYPGINLMEDLSDSDKKSVVLFSISADQQKDFAESFGALIMQDLTNVSSRKRELSDPIHKGDTHIYVDEFQAVNPDTVMGLLEKGRESKMGTTLISQSLSQVESANGGAGEAVLNTMFDTCSNFIVHMGSSDKSAEKISGIIGKHMVTVYDSMKESNTSLFAVNFFNRNDRRTTSREEEQWIRPTRELTSLNGPSGGKPGQAVYIKKNPVERTVNHVWSAVVDLYVDDDVIEKAEIKLPPAEEESGSEFGDDSDILEILGAQDESDGGEFDDEFDDDEDYDDEPDEDWEDYDEPEPEPEPEPAPPRRRPQKKRRPRPRPRPEPEEPDYDEEPEPPRPRRKKRKRPEGVEEEPRTRKKRLPQQRKRRPAPEPQEEDAPRPRRKAKKRPERPADAPERKRRVLTPEERKERAKRKPRPINKRRPARDIENGDDPGSEILGRF